MTRTCTIDLLDPELFRSARFHQLFEQLRNEGGLHRHPGEPDGFWVASNYAEVHAVYADTATYRSRQGMRLGSDADAVAGVADRQMVVSDAPNHTRVRRVANEAFTPRRLRRLVEPITDSVTSMLAAFRDSGADDFVAHVAAPLPVHVICAMMDLPRQDWDAIGEWSNTALESPDARARLAANAEIFMYFHELVERRREESDDSGDDVVSIMLRPPDKLKPLSDEEIVVNLNGILAGAVETLRYAAAGAVHAFAHHDEAFAALVAGDASTAATVEEILRWTAPGVHAMRTVAEDTELAGTALRAGERITVWNCSANRDDAVFGDGATFRPGRTPNHHLTFGWGPHNCIGSRLARIELAALVDCLRTVRAIEVGPGEEWSASNFIHGLTRLPVRFS